MSGPQMSVHRTKAMPREQWNLISAVRLGTIRAPQIVQLCAVARSLNFLNTVQPTQRKCENLMEYLQKTVRGTQKWQNSWKNRCCVWIVRVLSFFQKHFFLYIQRRTDTKNATVSGLLFVEFACLRRKINLTTFSRLLRVNFCANMGMLSSNETHLAK